MTLVTVLIIIQLRACSFSWACLQRFIRQLATSAAEALSHNPLKFVCVYLTQSRESLDKVGSSASGVCWLGQCQRSRY